MNRDYFLGIGLASLILLITSYLTDIIIPAITFIIYAVIKYFALAVKDEEVKKE